MVLFRFNQKVLALAVLVCNSGLLLAEADNSLMGLRGIPDDSNSRGLDAIYSLDQCELGCTEDDNCKPGLVCKFVTGKEVAKDVGDCDVFGKHGLMMCLASLENQLVHMTNSPKPFALKMCQGDCDDDLDCEPGLICYERDKNQNVPGCEKGGTGIGKEDYCAKPVANQLVLRAWPKGGYPISGAEDRSEGLLECEGDCDSDEDCAGDLKCQQRDGLETVYGCEGVPRGENGVSSFDYCYDDSSEQPSAAPTQEPTVAPSAAPTKKGMDECATDCQVDNDCDADLVCMIRKGKNKKKEVYGCKKTSLKKKNKGKNMCYMPKTIKECKTGCKKDSDCKGTLTCMIREKKRKDKSVPGCSTRKSKYQGENMCYSPVDKKTG